MATGEGTWTRPSCGLIFESRTQCLLHLRASHVAPEPKVVFKPPPAESAPAAVAPPLSAGDIRRDRADALYIYQKDGAWRLQNPNQQRMLVKIKHLDLSSVPYLTEGSRVLLLTGVETSYEPVAEAAGSSSVAPPAEASTVTAKPPSPVSSAAQAKASVAKPPKKAKGSVGAALSGASPAGTLQDRLSRRRRRRAPVVPPTAILLDVCVSKQKGARLVLRPVPATSPAKSPRVAGSAESPRRVTLAQDDTDDEPELIQRQSRVALSSLRHLPKTLAHRPSCRLTAQPGSPV